MKPSWRTSLLAVALAALTPGLRADTLTIPDRGQTRVFEVADPSAPEPVLYEVGQPRSAWSRRLATPRFAVKPAPGIDVSAVAADHGLTVEGPFAPLPAWTLLRATDSARALRALAALRADARLADAHLLLKRLAAKRLTPNDPLFPQQWHLRNTLAVSPPGLDVNVTNTWDTYRGNGVVIGIVDDGLQTTHPDLAPNVNTDWDYDWNDATPLDPNPDTASDFHGTACAGVAAARGNNGIGVSGAAPEATLVGLRLIGGAATDADEAAAMLHSNAVIHIKSNSWGPTDAGGVLEGPGPLTKEALSNACMTGRGGLGTILVWAGGNGRASDDNANLDGYANSIFTIAVGAVGDDGRFADYSDPGACLLVSALSSGSTNGNDIVTADLVGANGYNRTGAGDLADTSYTKTFGGTSSATPLAAGVIALMLEANPGLGWRDVQEILVRSARKNDPAGGSWMTNSAGLSFSHDYGAGLVDAGAALSLAATWTNLPAWTNTSRIETNLSLSIPDVSTAGVVRTFAIPETLRVEHVEVTVDITHPVRRQLEIVLTSPSGMTSKLAEQRPRIGANFEDWTLTSVRHWGESSAGTWSVRVADLAAGLFTTTGTLHSVRLTLYGSAPPAAPADSDGDGMDDAWEQEHFAGLGTAGSGTDADQDGFADVSEFIAGTIPTNAASLLVATAVEPAPSGLVVRWPSVSNRIYRLEQAASPTASFSAVATNLPATPPVNAVTTEPASAGGVYRVGVQ